MAAKKTITPPNKNTPKNTTQPHKTHTGDNAHKAHKGHNMHNTHTGHKAHNGSTMSTPVTPTHPHNPINKTIALILVTATIILAAVMGFTATQKPVRAEDGDWTRWIMCTLMPDPSKELYQLANTDDIPFEFRSKSIASPGAQKVDGFLNELITIGTEDNFTKTNEEILGRPLTAQASENLKDLDEETKKKLDEEKEKIKEAHKELVKAGMETTNATNGGTKVSPYERFGLSGMVFTNYLGEWKYLIVDACAAGSEPKDPKAGQMYGDRKAPVATWENRSNSYDIRVVQSTRGLFTNLLSAMENTAANVLFSITKFIIAFTLAIIFFSFSNVPEVMGFDKLVGGDKGVFSALFDGIFSPLLVIAFLFTAGYIFWFGAVKRQFRSAVTELGYSLLMVLIAFTMAAIPAKTIAFPNQVATAGQALIISAMGGQLHSTDGMCKRGATTTEITSSGGRATDDTSILEEANKNIRAAIGCTYWENFLLRPWSEGQFGVTYDQLWAKGHSSEATSSTLETPGEISNDNEEMVGKATVPLGGGQYMHNWAILQISTLTNAHAQIDAQTNDPTHYTNGVASDLWRLVDALSNYDEESKLDVVYQHEIAGHSTIEYKAQKRENVPSEHWAQWVGNNNVNRMGIAGSSILISGVAVAIPLVFALMSAVYSVGISLIMSLAPFMLLMGVWGARGRRYFLSWVSMLLNAVMSRIIYGALLVLTLIAQTALLQMSAEMNFWAILVSMTLIGVVMWKSRSKILALFATFNYGDGHLQNIGDQATKQVGAKANKYVINKPLNYAASMSGAVIGAKLGGGTIKGGLYDGIKYEIKNMAYRDPNLREINTMYELTRAQQGQDNGIKGKHCIACGKQLDYTNGRFTGGVVEAGTYVCEDCYNNQIHPDATIIHLKEPRKGTVNRQGWYDRKLDHRNEQLYKLQLMHQKMFGEKRTQQNETNKLLQELHDNKVFVGINSKLIDHNTQNYGSNAATTAYWNIIDSIKMDVATHRAQTQEKAFDDNMVVHTPTLPQNLTNITQHEDLLKQAWGENNYSYVIEMYAAGISKYINDESNGKIIIDPRTIVDNITSTTT